jgi:hypothetical protein
MPLRKGKIDGRVVVEIPDEEWKCPRCGTGPDNTTASGGGLVLECDGIEFPDQWLDPNGDVSCYGKKKDDIEVCGWGGSVMDVFKAAIRRKDMVTCPCCKGEGVVTKKKAESYKGKK